MSDDRENDRLNKLLLGDGEKRGAYAEGRAEQTSHSGPFNASADANSQAEFPVRCVREMRI